MKYETNIYFPSLNKYLFHIYFPSLNKYETNIYLNWENKYKKSKEKKKRSFELKLFF